MHRYYWKTSLNISCLCLEDSKGQYHRYLVEAQWTHAPYYDVALPSEASGMIWPRSWMDNSKYSKLHHKKVQRIFPTAEHVHIAWKTMSEVLRKRSSSNYLQQPYCWKKRGRWDIWHPNHRRYWTVGIANKEDCCTIIIRGRAVEVEVDPYEKLQIHLELSGYTTTFSVELRNRMKALKVWQSCFVKNMEL